jgi:acyl dehydratase
MKLLGWPYINIKLLERMGMKLLVIENVHELKNRVGTALGVSGWVEVTQEKVDRFADVTGDGQWIHVDPVAARKGPYGTTIAHGFLTLSLLPGMANQLYKVRNVESIINYGVNKVRFPSPLPVGSKVRGRFELLSATETKGRMEVVTRVTFEVEGTEKPVCVAESVRLYIPRKSEA